MCYSIYVILYFNNVLLVSLPARLPFFFFFFLFDCRFVERPSFCSYALHTRHSGGKICGVRAVRRACGAVVFVVYFPAFCENIISKLLFAFASHECWKHVIALSMVLHDTYTFYACI